MNVLEQVIRANQSFIEKLPKEYVNYNNYQESTGAQRKLAIFTCMDTRLVNFLEPAMGIERGEAKIIKNAGNSITGPFESTIRSLVVSIFELGVEEILVIGHFDCGVAKSTANGLIERMLARGISKDAIKMVEKDLRDWIDNFHHPVDNIRATVAQIRNNPLIPEDIPVHGLIMEPSMGALQVIIDGYKACKRSQIA